MGHSFPELMASMRFLTYQAGATFKIANESMEMIPMVSWSLYFSTSFEIRKNISMDQSLPLTFITLSRNSALARMLKF